MDHDPSMYASHSNWDNKHAPPQLAFISWDGALWTFLPSLAWDWDSVNSISKVARIPDMNHNAQSIAFQVDSQIWFSASKHPQFVKVLFWYLFQERTWTMHTKYLQHITKGLFYKVKLQWFLHSNIYFQMFWLNCIYYFNSLCMSEYIYEEDPQKLPFLYAHSYIHQIFKYIE
jgi:hypothetical protein